MDGAVHLPGVAGSVMRVDIHAGAPLDGDVVGADSGDVLSGMQTLAGDERLACLGRGENPRNVPVLT